ncbi:MAG: 3-oxoacyl-[acyl-carrier-protein] reductase [Phycisphaeraceae bacterium]|nr:3-oxoacyl-[acyl-carrier-protein] reductase [Phycisphaeraceae bacterium]|tara:strand:+ start:145 stop:891 length:747 start_codon:yes stop_codon:yes gene_type:complete
MTDTPIRVAVVTGASRGIGAEIAKALAEQGRHVVLMARNVEALDAVQGQIHASGGVATVIPCDVSDHQAMADAIESVYADHKRLDILVNNAGITRDNLLVRMSDDEFDEVIAVNLRSVFISCRAALKPMMRGKWGRIINISSVSAVVGNPGQANYAASKAAVTGLTKSLAKEMAGKNITANVVAPGFIETDMTTALPQRVKDAAIQATPLRRFGQAMEIAAAVAYLASDTAGFTTGQVLVVDGGMTMA